MDYPLPRALHIALFQRWRSPGYPPRRTGLAFSSGAESGTTPALAPLINPVVDSLAEPGVSHVEMP